MRRNRKTGWLVLAALLAALGGGGTLQPSVPVAGPPDWPGMKISAFIRLSARDFSQLTGARLTLKDRVSFTMMKWQMKKVAKKNPEMTVSQYLVTEKKKDATVLIIVIAVVVIIAAIVIAKSVGPGPINWGEGG